MNKVTVQATLLTPSFLGGAHQTAEWRSPPFKALLRHWWRVAVAADHQYDHTAIREAEGRVFGHAFLKNGRSTWAKRSSVSIRVRETESREWAPGSLDRLPHLGKVQHPEVEPKGKMEPGPQGQGAMVHADVYLGFGPVGVKGLQFPPALAAGSSAEIRIACRQQESLSALMKVVELVEAFGCVGGRSRNGWGSLALKLGDGSSGEVLDPNAWRAFLRPVEECMDLEWPHAIGSDREGPLVWRTPSRSDWQSVMEDLARVKVKTRTSLEVGSRLSERHLLAYPVTHHSVKSWKSGGRLANQLRFKIHRTNKSDGSYVGRVFHVPHGLPKVLRSSLPAGDQRWVEEHELEVWHKVHSAIDERLERLA